MSIRKKPQPHYFMKGEKPRILGLLKATVTSLFIITPITIILHQPIFRGYESWLMPSNQDPTADIAVVLDYNPPRVESAVELFREKKVKGIYIDTPLQDTIKEISREYDVPTNLLYWGGCGATTTYEQAMFFAEAREAAAFPAHQSIVIVTSPHHLRRALWSFKHVLERKKADLKVKSYAAKDDRLRNRLDWWQYEYAREWISWETQKNIFYRFRYGFLRKEHINVPYHSFFDKEGTTGTVDISSKCQKNGVASLTGG